MVSLRKTYHRVAVFILVLFIAGGWWGIDLFTRLQTIDRQAGHASHIVSKAAEQMELVSDRRINQYEIGQWQRNMVLITQDLDHIARIRSESELTETRRFQAWADELFSTMSQNRTSGANMIYLDSFSTVLLCFTSSAKTLNRLAIDERRLVSSQIRQLLTAFILVVVLFAAATGIYLYRYVLHPLGIVEATIQSFGKGWHEARAPQTGVLEIDLLANKFNQAADQLEATTVSRDALEVLVEQLNQNERALSIAKEAAEVANRAKSTFLTTMSHELRTPMNGILGMTTLAMQNTTDPRQKDQLSKLKQSGDKLLGLINNILEYSKSESELLASEATPFVLSDILENFNNHNAQKAKGKGIAYTVEMEPSLSDQTLIGDWRHLSHVFYELTDNAIKFTNRGAVTVRMKVDEENTQDLLLRLEIEDTGIGISGEDAKQLFTAFRQVDGSNTRPYGGSGLGLALSRRLARALGGDIGVASESGAGSTFWFTARMQKKALNT